MSGVLDPDKELKLQSDRKVPNIKQAPVSPSASISEANALSEQASQSLSEVPAGGSLSDKQMKSAVPVSPSDVSEVFGGNPDGTEDKTLPEVFADANAGEYTKPEVSEQPNIYNPGFPIPVNIQYQDPTIHPDEITVPGVLGQYKQEAESKFQEQDDYWQKVIADTLSTPNSLSSAQFWYPEGYFDLKRQVGDTDQWYRDYSTGKFQNDLQSVGNLSFDAGASGSFTTGTQNAVERNFPLVSRFGKQLAETVAGWGSTGKGGFNIFELNAPALVAKALMPGGIEDIKNKFSSTLENLSPLNKKDTGEAEFNPIKGQFGEFGKAGYLSASLYLLNVPQNLLMSGIYSVTDAIQGKKVNPVTRVLDSLKGTDYGFMNQRSDKKYLSTVDPKATGAKAVAQWGAGFVLDVITGGFTDSLVSAVTKSGKTAAKTAQQLAARAPDFTKGIITKAPTPTVPTSPITTERLRKGLEKYAKEMKAPSSQLDRQLRKVEEMSNIADNLRGLSARSTPQQQAEAVRDVVLPKEMRAYTPSGVEKTWRVMRADTEYRRLATETNQAYTRLVQANNNLADDLAKLEELPNVERAPLPSQETTKEFLNVEPPVQPVGKRKRLDELLAKAKGEGESDRFDELIKQAEEITGGMQSKLDELEKGLTEQGEDLSKLSDKELFGEINKTLKNIDTADSKIRSIAQESTTSKSDKVVEFPSQESIKQAEDLLAASGFQKLKPPVVSQGVVELKRPSWYHGSKLDTEDLASIRPNEGSAFNELGAGLYLTDNADLASKYAMAHPQLNKPAVPGNWSEVGNVYEVVPRVKNTLDASELPPSNVRRIFVEAADEVGLDHDALISYRHTLPKLTLDKYWTTFREMYADLHPGEFVPEDLMIEFQRLVSEKLYDQGYQAINKTAPDGSRILNVLQPTDNSLLPTQTLSKVPVGTGDILEQKSARLETDQWAEEVFGSTTHKANTHQSRASLASELANIAETIYRGLEENAMDAAENLTRLEDDLIEQTVKETREEASEIAKANAEKPAKELEHYNKDTDKPCL